MADPKDAFGRTVSRRSFLSMAAVAGAAVAGGGLLAGCGGGSAGGQPAPAVRVVEALVGPPARSPGPLGPTRRGRAVQGVLPELQPSNGNKVTWQQVVTTSPSSSRSSPAVAPPMRSTSVTAIWRSSSRVASWRTSPHSSTSESPVKASDTYPGLIKWCKPVNGEGLFGVPVDCNPKIFWFNQDMLTAAGVSTNPAQLFEAAPGTRPRWTTC